MLLEVQWQVLLSVPLHSTEGVLQPPELPLHLPLHGLLTVVLLWHEGQTFFYRPPRGERGQVLPLFQNHAVTFSWKTSLSLPLGGVGHCGIKENIDHKRGEKAKRIFPVPSVPGHFGGFFADPPGSGPNTSQSV